MLRLRTLAVMAALAFATQPAALRAQDELPEAPSLAPSIDRARDVFQDALERIWIPNHRLADGPQVRAAFADAVTDAARCVVQVRCDGEQVALGAVVGPNGWVLTKATQLADDPIVRLKDGRELAARVTGVDKSYDLAMLKIDADGLEPLPLDPIPDLRDGDWLATVGTGKQPVAVGVLSVSPREIPHQSGLLGVFLEDSRRGAVVVQVFPDSAAEAAGLYINDVVLSVNGTKTKDRPTLIKAIKSHSPGDTVDLLVQRNQETIRLQATLTGRAIVMGPSRSDYQNSLGSELSRRRFGFPSALQHDTVLPADKCGGPVVNLDGQVVGFNIARAGRTETYAVPASVVRELAFDLMNGRLAPQQAAGEEPARAPAQAGDSQGEQG